MNARSTVTAFTLLTLLLPVIANAQQYMKKANVTDAQFNGWINSHAIVRCRATAQAAYPDGPKDLLIPAFKPSGVCYWDIDRSAAVAPPALVVHAGTRILVRIHNPRENEVILPALVYSKVSPPSLGNDVLKNAVNPLQAITLAAGIVAPPVIAAAVVNVCDTTAPGYNAANADSCQSQLTSQVNSIQASINHANAALACLESYQAAVGSTAPEQTTPPPSIPAYTCSPSVQIGSVGANPFATERANLVATISTALSLTPPAATFTQLDTFMNKTPATFTTELSIDGEIKNAIGNIQSAQATLQQNYVLLLSIPSQTSSQFYYFDIPHLTTATATVTGTEIISKTSSNIATWTAASTSYNAVFSGGLGFSNLVYRTYASTSQVQNGMPVLNPSGNAISVVTETDVKMSVMAPEILGSYVIPGLRRFDSACSFGCSVLVSGGIGANLTSKAADFDTGVSLRLMDFLLTPAVHFGRESRLADGITVGSQLGAGAPSTLPTQSKWVRKFGVVFTYVIPLS